MLMFAVHTIEHGADKVCGVPTLCCVQVGALGDPAGQEAAQEVQAQAPPATDPRDAAAAAPTGAPAEEPADTCDPRRPERNSRRDVREIPCRSTGR